MSEGLFEERVTAVSQLLQLFRIERFIYIATSVISVGIIIWLGIELINNGSRPAELVGIFGSGGLISIGIGRLLTMWTQALQMVAGQSVS